MYSRSYILYKDENFSKGTLTHNVIVGTDEKSRLVATKYSRAFFRCWFWEICCEINCKWVLFVYCVAFYIIDLLIYTDKTCGWILMSMFHLKKDFHVFVFFYGLLICVCCGRQRTVTMFVGVINYQQSVTTPTSKIRVL